MSRPSYLPLPRNRPVARLGLGTWILLLVLAALVAAGVAAGVAFLVFAGGDEPPRPPDKWAPMPAVPMPAVPMPVVPMPSDEQALDVPEWYLNPPQEPGRAFYAVGMVDRAEHLLPGKRAAEARAKEELAGVLTTCLQSVLKDYLRSMESEDGPPVEEQVIQRVARLVVNEVVSEATIVKIAFGDQRADGTMPAFALARVSLDVVATALNKQASKNLSVVHDNSESAFAELDKLLNTQTERTAKPAQMPSGPGR